jgi:mRNA interferase RelE/StbE
MYEVLLHPDAQKVYVDADKALAKKIARCLQQLEKLIVSIPTSKHSRGIIQGTIATVLETTGRSIQ